MSRWQAVPINLSSSSNTESNSLKYNTHWPVEMDSIDLEAIPNQIGTGIVKLDNEMILKVRKIDSRLENLCNIGVTD